MNNKVPSRVNTYNKRVDVCMCNVWPRIPSPKILCVLYVTINLIKVNRTSIAVATVLTILFCVRIDVQVSKAKYGRTHTHRYFEVCLLQPKDAFHSASNHGEGVALRQLS